MSDALMMRPTDVLRRMLTTERPDVSLDDGFRLGFLYGRLAMGLEVVTADRILAGTVGTSLVALSREEIRSVLDTLLKQQEPKEFADQVMELYEQLLVWRRLKFVDGRGDNPEGCQGDGSGGGRDDEITLDGVNDGSHTSVSFDDEARPGDQARPGDIE